MRVTIFTPAGSAHIFGLTACAPPTSHPMTMTAVKRRPGRRIRITPRMRLLLQAENA